MAARMVISVGLLALALGASAGARPARAVRQLGSDETDTVVTFRLGDQFGRQHDATTYRGQAWLLVGAANGGRVAAAAWVETLRAVQDDTTGERVPRTVPVVAVADLRGVPRLLRRFVRARFPRDPERAVLLDWDGSLARRFGFDGAQSTILLVDPSGRPAARTRSTAVDSALARTLVHQAATTAGTVGRATAPR